MTTQLLRRLLYLSALAALGSLAFIAFGQSVPPPFLTITPTNGTQFQISIDGIATSKSKCRAGSFVPRIPSKEPLMKTRTDTFEEASQKAFSFLEKFGFELVESIKDDYGCRLTYKNNTSAVRIELERAIMSIDC